MDKVKRYLMLSAREKKLLREAFLLIWGMKIAMRFMPFNRICRIAERSGSGTQPEPGAVERLPWAIESSGRYVPRATCLVRALAGQALFSRYGQRTDLRLGVRKKEKQKAIEAHAWLEYRGRVMIGGEVGGYIPLGTRMGKQSIGRGLGN